MKVTGDMPVVVLADGHKIRVAHIPMEALAPFEPAAVRAFGKRLPELRLHGGITAAEALAIIEERPWEAMPEKLAHRLLQMFLAGYARGLVVATTEPVLAKQA